MSDDDDKLSLEEQLERAAQQPDDSRYLLLDKLGQGGMGVVWLADKLGPTGAPLRTVVLKTVLPFVGSDEERERRAALFLREIAVTAALQHRNIVRVNDWGTNLFGDTHFFEMELIRGLSLLDLLARRGVPLDAHHKWGPLPAQDVAWIGMQAAAGLHYAHNHARTGEGDDGAHVGVAHRDISPDNIMVDVDGEVKLTDWGITKALDAAGDASRTGMIAGKAKYMAPEQIRGQIDTRADVYSLGVTLTVALAGKDVFPTTPSSSWESLAMAVLQGERQRAAELAPGAPPALTDLLESMMQLEREHRPRTAGELVGRFKDIARQLGGDLHDVQQAFAARVQEHHKEGKRTKRAMQAHRTPTKSTPRPISAATRPEPSAPAPHPATERPATEPLLGAASTTRPLTAATPAAGSPPLALAAAPSTSRSTLWVALVAGSAALVLLAGLAGFLLAGSALLGDDETGTPSTVITPSDEGRAEPQDAPPSPAAEPTPAPSNNASGAAPPPEPTQTPMAAPDESTAAPLPHPETAERPPNEADGPAEAHAESEARPHPRPRTDRPHRHTPTPQPRPFTTTPAPTPRTPERPSGRQMGGSNTLGL